MNGFNVGVLVSLGDMELALDYLNDEEVFEPEITEYQKDRQQKSEQRGLSDGGQSKYEVTTPSSSVGIGIDKRSISIRESAEADEDSLKSRGIDVGDSEIVEVPSGEDTSGDWDESYSNEYSSEEDGNTSSQYPEAIDIDEEEGDTFPNLDSLEAEGIEGDEDEDDEGDDIEDDEGDDDIEDNIEGDEEDSFPSCEDLEDDIEDEEDSFPSCEDLEEYDDPDDSSSPEIDSSESSLQAEPQQVQDDSSDEERELERQILEAQRKLQEAKERKNRAIAAKQALKAQLEQTLREINKLESESSALEAENEHASGLLNEANNINKKDDSVLGSGGRAPRVQSNSSQGQSLAAKPVRRQGTRTARPSQGTEKPNSMQHEPRQVQQRHPAGEVQQRQRSMPTAVKRPAQSTQQVQSSVARGQQAAGRTMVRPPKSVRKPQPPERQPTKEEQYGSLDIDTLYSKVVEFLVTHGVSKSAIDKSILDNEFGVANINKLIMKSYLISMGKKVTIGK